MKRKTLNKSLNIEEIFRHHFGAFVDRLPGAVEHPTEHVLGYWSAKDVASKLACRLLSVNARCSLKHLYDCLGSRYFEDLTSPV